MAARPVASRVPASIRGGAWGDAAVLPFAGPPAQPRVRTMCIPMAAAKQAAPTRSVAVVA